MHRHLVGGVAADDGDSGGAVARLVVCRPIDGASLQEAVADAAAPSAVEVAQPVVASPASSSIRLTAAGTETSNRASEFLFIGIAFIVASPTILLLRPKKGGGPPGGGGH